MISETEIENCRITRAFLNSTFLLPDDNLPFSTSTGRKADR
jgi:hypothetical protein